MNVVTGFFVGNALKAAEKDMEENTARNLWSMLSVDPRWETNITRDDFESHYTQPHMQHFFETLAITADEARDNHFFQLIDTDNSGSIDAKEVIRACLRLQGPAKAISLAAFLWEFREERQAEREHRLRIEALLAKLATSGRDYI